MKKKKRSIPLPQAISIAFIAIQPLFAAAPLYENNETWLKWVILFVVTAIYGSLSVKRK